MFATLPLLAQTDLGRVAPEGPLHLIAFGDFGSGKPQQTEVAQAMLRRHQQKPFGLGITMGDNFYRCGVRSDQDRKWTTRWENLYTPLGIRFYATLGNHDYGMPRIICPAGGASPDAEIARTKLSASWRMPARYYTFVAGSARFFAIDTEGWSSAQLEWIKQALAASAKEPGVRWRIVYGHHPLYTSGVHLNQRRIGALRRELLPVIKAAGVDLVISGHDHDMERLQADGIDLLIAGSGGAELRRPHKPIPESRFSVARYGFLDVDVTPDHITAQFLDTGLRQLDPNPLDRQR